MAIEVGELLARMKLDTSGMQAGMDKLSTLTSDITKQFDAMKSELEGSTGAIAGRNNVPRQKRGTARAYTLFSRLFMPISFIHTPGRCCHLSFP